MNGARDSVEVVSAPGKALHCLPVWCNRDLLGEHHTPVHVQTKEPMVRIARCLKSVFPVFTHTTLSGFRRLKNKITDWLIYLVILEYTNSVSFAFDALLKRHTSMSYVEHPVFFICICVSNHVFSSMAKQLHQSHGKAVNVADIETCNM